MTEKKTRGRPRSSDSNSSEISTKERIFDIAVRLFSDFGYPKVSMRDIARESRISVAAIYNHFPSKDAFLVEMYDFYTQNQKKCLPDINALLKLCETEPPVNVLLDTIFHYPPQIQENMDRIIVVAAMESCSDERSATFIQENILDLPYKFTKPLLNRMLELGRIEPIDIDGFVILISNLSYSGAVRNYSKNPYTLEDWMRSMTLLYSLIKTKQ